MDKEQNEGTANNYHPTNRYSVESSKKRAEKLEHKYGKDGFKLIERWDDNAGDFTPPTDSPELVGIAIEFEYGGDYCRAAVVLPKQPSRQDWIMAFNLLLKAKHNPFHPDVKCVFGIEPLTGKEMRPDYRTKTDS